MKTNRIITWSLPALALLALSTLNSQLATALAQGSLTPPGPPAPTMKSADQIYAQVVQNEPRTPISSAPFTISQPGSYYLTTNLVAQSYVKDGIIFRITTAITIATNGVTLNLNGFTISSAYTSAGGNAILLGSGVSDITIVNGHICSGVTNNNGAYGGGGFAYGIYYSGAAPANVVVSKVSVAGVLNDGINLGNGNATVAEACTVTKAGGNGIVASTITGSVATGSGNYGIYNLGAACVVRGCVSQNNGIAGIICGAGIVSGCTANNNGGDGITASCSVSGCTANYNGADGIHVYPGTVSGCLVSNNGHNGIWLDCSQGSLSGNEAVGNTCIGNNTANLSGYAGIYIFDNNSRIENNHVTASGFAGILVYSGYTNNIIIKNSVSGNGANNYVVPAGNDLGPVGTAATATSPWANISH